MINYRVKYTKEFKKSLKKIIKQGKDINKLLDVVEMLVSREKLASKYRDHALHNDKKFNGCRDLHIEPDWILIYKYLDNETILLLVNTGSHSDVLGM